MLRVHAAARELGLHPLTVRSFIKQGKIQAFRVGVESRIPRAEQDLGSGISTTRKQLQRLLRLVVTDEVAEIAITYPDRLTRFGQAYLDLLFEAFGTTVTVLEPDETKTPEADLTRDLLSLIASFSGRLYGIRSHQQKARRTSAKQVVRESEEGAHG